MFDCDGLLQDAIKPAVDALVEAMLDTSAAPPPAFKLLLDFLDDKAVEFDVPADIVNARWKPSALLHAALLPVVRWPQALLNVRINAATGNRCACSSPLQSAVPAANWAVPFASGDFTNSLTTVAQAMGENGRPSNAVVGTAVYSSKVRFAITVHWPGAAILTFAVHYGALFLACAGSCCTSR